MGLLRQNTTGSYKLIVTTYNETQVGRKIELGLSTKYPEEARYRALIVLRALHLAGLTLNPALRVAVAATDREGGERMCDVSGDWLDDRILSCRRQMLEQVRNDRISELEARVRKLHVQNCHLKAKLTAVAGNGKQNTEPRQTA